MNEQNQDKPDSGSMLDNIIRQAQLWADQGPQPTTPAIPENAGTQETSAWNPPPDKKPKKVRDPLSTGLILKFIGTLFLIAIIFFGSFLAYVVFNPAQAWFFVTVFGINPNDIANLLRKLINSIFGIVSTSLAIIWIICLFRAIWTPKEFKRKKLLNWLIAGTLGILFFSVLGFWAFLFSIINATDYTNPGGSVLAYDNDLYVHSETRDISRIDRFDNLIGPITIRYDISQNAEYISKKNGVRIEWYDINFDGAKCQNGDSEIQGSNPSLDQGIICTFDTQKNYNIRGFYTLISPLWEKKTVSIPLDPVEIRGLLKIQNQKNKDGKTITTIDATGVQNLWTPRWIYSTDMSNIHQVNVINEVPSAIPLIVYLNVQNIKGKDFDRAFLIKDDEPNNWWGTIEYTRSEDDQQQYTFTASGLSVDQNKIMSIDWILNNDTKICRDSTRMFCTYRFWAYGQYKIRAEIKMVDGTNITITQEVSIDAPIQLERRVRVTTIDGKQLNTQNTWDPQTSTYVIKNLVPPETIVFDARDILASNVGYSLKSVDWKIFNGTSTTNRIGDRIELAINKSVRHTITAEYVFEKNIKTGTAEDTKRATDTVIIDLDRLSLVPTLKIQQSSDYVPAKITVDWSESKSELSDIIQFIYDFWEGRPETVWDAIQTYQYLTPGEKTITLTIVDSNGERASIKKQVVLKSTPDTIEFTSSISPGIINTDVDFIASGTSGQIEDYIWNFWDNSDIWHGYEVNHKYASPGTYTVTLTVKYINGTEKTIAHDFKVVESLE